MRGPAIVLSVQRSQPRLEALSADFGRGHDHLHALGGGEIAGGFEDVGAGGFELDIVGLLANEDLRFGGAAVDIDRLFIGIQDVKRELVAVGDQFPMLFAAAGIDDVTALRALGPLAIAVRESGGRKGKAQDECKCRNMLFSWLRWRLASVGLAHLELGLNGRKPLQRFRAVSEEQDGSEDGIEQRRSDQAAEDDNRHRVEDLLARRVGTNH